MHELLSQSAAGLVSSYPRIHVSMSVSSSSTAHIVKVIEDERATAPPHANMSLLPMLPLLLAMPHGTRPAPRSKEHFTRLVDRTCLSNSTLLDYFFPSTRTRNTRDNWVSHTEHCVMSHRCYCSHVRGSKDKDSNPPEKLLEMDRRVGGACESTGSANLMKRRITRATCTKRLLAKTCSCWTGRGAPCLYSDMKPPTSVVLISIARAAGVDHIIEEGREGGLSAFIYQLHGFRVTSVEYLPEDEPTAALRAMAPHVGIVDGDGSALIPKMVNEMSAEEAARTMVIFDGEKRVQAHNTFKKIREKVAFAAFDDSQVPEFRDYLDAQGETWFETELNSTSAQQQKLLSMWYTDTPAAVRRGGGASGKDVQHGSHTTIVRGGGWGRFSGARHYA